MITISHTWIVSLIVVWMLLFLVMALAHLYHRPELRGGRVLSRVASHAWGLGLTLAAILALALWRGIDGPLAIVDVAAIGMAAAIPPVLFRHRLGEPVAKPPVPQTDADVQQAIADIRRNASEVATR